jgi:hypothetical protein
VFGASQAESTHALQAYVRLLLTAMYNAVAAVRPPGSLRVSGLTERWDLHSAAAAARLRLRSRP